MKSGGKRKAEKLNGASGASDIDGEPRGSGSERVRAHQIILRSEIGDRRFATANPSFGGSEIRSQRSGGDKTATVCLSEGVKALTKSSRSP